MRTAALVAAAWLAAAPASAASAKDAPAKPAPALVPAAPPAALQAFITAFGASGADTLIDHGYLVVQDRGGDARLVSVHWKALEALAAAAPSCRALARDFKTAAEGVLAPASADEGLAPCRALPPIGAMTPRLQALASALSAYHQERWSLSSSSAAVQEPHGLPNLFDEPWGKDLARDRRADRLEDPSPLARGFFDDLLAGPRPDAKALAHFAAVCAARGTAGVPALVAADATRGYPSDELRALIVRYLRDERRRLGLREDQARLQALLKDKAAMRDLDALDGLAAVLVRSPDALTRLEAAVSGAPAPAGGPRLRSAGLHLQAPTRLGQYELGDEATVSGAYWVDGLPEGRKAEFEETTFVETPDGDSAVSTRRVKRADGGPYPYERTLTIASPRGFSVRSIVSAAGAAPLDERVEVPVAPDFGLALGKEAAALRDLQACDPRSAGKAYEALVGMTADAAKVKPQYEALLKRARRGETEAADDAETLAKLDEAVTASREDSSPKLCRYDASRTDAAVKLARRLPPGCDRVLPELFAQRRLISRRAEDKRWFLKASERAASRLKRCDYEDAARIWTGALAVLEADPAARCGDADAAAKDAETSLERTRLLLAWTRGLDMQLDRAETAKDQAVRLSLAEGVIARIGALDDASCRRDALKRAERLAASAGASLPFLAYADAEKRLPREPDLPALTASVRAARAAALGAKAEAGAAPEAAPSAAVPESSPAEAAAAGSILKPLPAEVKIRPKTKARRRRPARRARKRSVRKAAPAQKAEAAP
jgi:hypothetical protein